MRQLYVGTRVLAFVWKEVLILLFGFTLLCMASGASALIVNRLMGRTGYLTTDVFTFFLGFSLIASGLVTIVFGLPMTFMRLRLIRKVCATNGINMSHLAMMEKRDRRTIGFDRA